MSNFWGAVHFSIAFFIFLKTAVKIHDFSLLIVKSKN